MIGHVHDDHATIESALNALADGIEGDDASYGELLERLGARGYGFGFLLLAAPNVTPGPAIPGFSTIFGLAMVVLAVQMLRGIASPRLPEFLARRRVTRAGFKRFIGVFARIAAKADRVLRSRWPGFVARRVASSLVLLILGVLLCLPIPLVSYVSAAAAILIAAGLIGRDGALIAAGQAGAVVSVVLYLAVGWIALAAFGIA
jgi:hypothetical protein